MDLASGYWQVGMHPEDQHQPAFASHRVLSEFKVLPFGLCSAPETFERLVEFVLAGLIGTSCLVYLDDILIFSRTFEEHLVRLCEVLCRLKDAGLKIKPSKCFLFREEIGYLGHIVSAQGISTHPKKTEAIQDYPVPQNIQEVRRFVGFASCNGRFIPNFAELAAPLHQLTKKKSIKFLWTQECQNAFQKLQEVYRSTYISFSSF